MRRSVVPLFALLLSAATVLLAAVPQRLTDFPVSVVALSSTPRFRAAVGRVALFTTRSGGTTLRPLWRTDGSSDRTYPLLSTTTEIAEDRFLIDGDLVFLRRMTPTGGRYGRPMARGRLPSRRWPRTALPCLPPATLERPFRPQIKSG